MTNEEKKELDLAKKFNECMRLMDEAYRKSQGLAPVPNPNYWSQYYATEPNQYQPAFR